MKNRLFILYVLVVLMFVLGINKKQAYLNRLNYLKNADSYLLEYYDGKEDFRRFGFLGAARYYQEITKHLARLPLPYGNAAACYFLLGDWEKAAAFTRKAITVFPEFYAFYYDLGVIDFLQNDFKKAKENLEKSLKLIELAPVRWAIEKYAIAKEAGSVFRRDQDFVDKFLSEDRRDISRYLAAAYVCLGDYPEGLPPLELEQMKMMCTAGKPAKAKILESFRPHIYRIIPGGNG